VGFNGNISAAALRKQKIHSRFPGYLETISTIFKLFKQGVRKVDVRHTVIFSKKIIRWHLFDRRAKFMKSF